MALKIAVAGVAGRMGQTLVRAIAASEEVVLSGALGAPDKPYLGQDAGVLANVKATGVAISDSAERAITGADVVIDFMRAPASVSLAMLCAEQRKPLVIGTTGFSQDDDAQIRKAAEQTAIVKSGNMSLGVTVLAALVRQAAKALPDFDIEIIEMHHRMKADAPSGTALLLGEAASDGRGVALNDVRSKERTQNASLRKSGEIGFASLRGGSVVGEHEVILAGKNERLTLAHSAQDRSIFANGALTAARWVVGKPPGPYTMADVLGLNGG